MENTHTTLSISSDSNKTSCPIVEKSINMLNPAVDKSTNTVSAVSSRIEKLCSMESNGNGNKGNIVSVKAHFTSEKRALPGDNLLEDHYQPVTKKINLINHPSLSLILKNL